MRRSRALAEGSRENMVNDGDGQDRHSPAALPSLYPECLKLIFNCSVMGYESEKGSIEMVIEPV